MLPVRYELNLYIFRVGVCILLRARVLTCTSIYICYVEENRPPLWSSGQSCWLQNRDVLATDPEVQVRFRHY
jgi:hypothetical protein